MSDSELFENFGKPDATPKPTLNGIITRCREYADGADSDTDSTRFTNIATALRALAAALPQQQAPTPQDVNRALMTIDAALALLLSEARRSAIVVIRKALSAPQAPETGTPPHSNNAHHEYIVKRMREEHEAPCDDLTCDSAFCLAMRELNRLRASQPDAPRTKTLPTIQGTLGCPVCGDITPHYHAGGREAAWRDRIVERITNILAAQALGRTPHQHAEAVYSTILRFDKEESRGADPGTRGEATEAQTMKLLTSRESLRAKILADPDLPTEAGSALAEIEQAHQSGTPIPPAPLHWNGLESAAWTQGWLAGRAASPPAKPRTEPE